MSAIAKHWVRQRNAEMRKTVPAFKKLEHSSSSFLILSPNFPYWPACVCAHHDWLFVTHGHARLLCPWNLPGKNTGVGCHFLLQGIFQTQELNPHLLQAPALASRFFTAEPPGKPIFMLLLLLNCFSRVWLCGTHRRQPTRLPVHGIFQARILESVAISFPRGSSRPRDQTQVSYIIRWILYHLSHHGRPSLLIIEK